MTVQQLDFFFPFFVFFYGILALVVIETPYFKGLGEKFIPEIYLQLQQRRNLAWISFYIGGVWSLQNIIF